MCNRAHWTTCSNSALKILSQAWLRATLSSSRVRSWLKMRRQGIEKQFRGHLRMNRQMIHLKTVAIVKHIQVGRHLSRKTILAPTLQNKAWALLYRWFRKRQKKWPPLRHTKSLTLTKTTPSSQTQNMIAHLFSKLKSRKARRTTTASPWRSPSRITTTSKTYARTNSLRAQRTHLSISSIRAQTWHSKRCPSRHRASYSCWTESCRRKKTKCIRLMATISSLLMCREMDR